MFELLNRLLQYFQYIIIKKRLDKIIPSKNIEDTEDTEDMEDSEKSKYFNNIVDDK